MPIIIEYFFFSIAFNHSNIIITMRYCPLCGNLLFIEMLDDSSNNTEAQMQFCCPTCPYQYNLDKTFLSQVKLRPKQIDDVLGGEEAWKNVDSTSARCPFCSNDVSFQTFNIIRFLM